ILVSTLDDNVEWLDLDGGARVTARGPSREVQPAVAKYGRSTNRAGDAARRPNLLAGVQLVRGYAQRAGHHDLLAAAHLPDHRRAEATQEFRAIGPPDR